MWTWLLLDGAMQFMTWLAIGICVVIGFCAMAGFAYTGVAMVRIKRERGGAADGPHRGTIGDGRL